jgi:dimethylaniline monooxygenase (N-oxide forming)
MRPTVCVIGAGVSGIACVKELSELNIDVEVYEMMPILGGVFSSYGWKGGQLTSSSVFTWFSQYPAPNRQIFFTWEEFLEYLNGYVNHFNLADRIHLNSKVVSAEWRDRKWRIRIKQKNWSNGHYFHPKQDVQEKELCKEYTHLIVCSGLHNSPAIPDIESLSQFTGTIIHSRDYRNADDFRHQRVLVVGCGESGSDIAAQISAVAKECAISMRSAPGTLFPRYIQGNTADIRDDRLTYNLPRLWWPLILRGHRHFYLAQTSDKELFAWAAESNFQNKRCPFNANACKSFGIPEAIIRNGAALKPAINAVRDREIIFEDRSSGNYDAIVFCTGYKVEFEFFERDISDLLLPVNKLWNNCVSLEFQSHLLLVGFSRPQQINLVSVAEMQARLAALLIAGIKQLPSKAELLQSIRRDQQWMRTYYHERYSKNPALIDFLYYMDSVAKFVGCAVPLGRAFFRDPYLWLKLMFAPLNGAHYRLVGPGSQWRVAAQTVKQTPQFSNWRNAILRWCVLSMVTVVSLVCSPFIRQFRLIKQRAGAE